MALDLFKEDMTDRPGGMRPIYWALGILSLVPLCVVSPMVSPKMGVAIISSWIILLWVCIGIARRRIHSVLPLWIAIFPYCYYFLSFPAERSIFTVDRALILLLLIDLAVTSRKDTAQTVLPHDIQVSGYLWGLYLLACFISLSVHPTSNVLPSYRLLVDGMVMPAVLGFYVMNRFPLIEHLRGLHVCTCILGIGLFLTGLCELITGADLLPWNGSEPMYTGTQLRRADGPFEQQIVLTLVGILVFFFLVFLGRLEGDGVSMRRKVLHRAGCLSALGASLLPLNRGLIFALVPIAIIEFRSKHRLISRRIWALFFGAVLLITLATKFLDERLYEDRVSGLANLYQRLAQHHETLRVVSDYPFFGVGFALYGEVASGNPRYMARWNGIESMNVQHNALMTVLSDQGIVGLLLYLSAQFFFFQAMWKIRKAYVPGWLAFLYCSLVYLLIGLDFATVYFADINLFYLLALAVIYKWQTIMARNETLSTQWSPTVLQEC
jgi:hypothetical protein